MYKSNENIGIGIRYRQVPKIKVSVSGEYWKKWYRCIPSQNGEFDMIGQIACQSSFLQMVNWNLYFNESRIFGNSLAFIRQTNNSQVVVKLR